MPISFQKPQNSNSGASHAQNFPRASSHAHLNLNQSKVLPYPDDDPTPLIVPSHNLGALEHPNLGHTHDTRGSVSSVSTSGSSIDERYYTPTQRHNPAGNAYMFGPGNRSDSSLEALSPTSSVPLAHQSASDTQSLTVTPTQNSSLLSPFHNNNGYAPLAPVPSASSTKTATPSSPTVQTPIVSTPTFSKTRDNSPYDPNSPQDGFGIANYDPWQHTQSPSPSSNLNNLSPSYRSITGKVSGSSDGHSSGHISRTNLQYHTSISSDTGSSTRSSSVRSNTSTNTTNSSYFSVTSMTNHGNQQHQPGSYGVKSAADDNVSHLKPPPIPAKIPLETGNNNEYIFNSTHASASHVHSPLQTPFVPLNSHTNTFTNSSLAPTNYLQRAPSAPEVPISERSSMIADSAAIRPRKAYSQINQVRRSNGMSPRLATSILAGSGTTAASAGPLSVASTGLNSPVSSSYSFGSPSSPTSLEHEESTSPISSIGRNSSISTPDPLITTSEPEQTIQGGASIHPTISRSTTTSTDDSVTAASGTSKANSGAWHEFWEIPLEELEGGLYNKYDINFQSELHSFIGLEKNFVHGMTTFLTVFGDRRELNRALPNASKKLDVLQKTLFDPTEKLISVNEKYLLGPFLKQQNEKLEMTPRTKDVPMLVFLTNNVREWLSKVSEPFFVWATSQAHADNVVSELMLVPEFKAFVKAGDEKAVKACQKSFDYLKNFPRNRFLQYRMHFAELVKFLEKKKREINEDLEKPPEDRDPTLLSATDPQPIIQGIEACILEIMPMMTKFNQIIAFEGSKVKMTELERMLRFKHDEHKMSLHLKYNPKEPLHDLILEKEIYRKKGSWESNYVLMLLDHMIILVRKERDSWLVVERPIHLELLRIESVSDPEYKSAIQNAVTRQTGQATRQSVSSHNPSYTHKASVSSTISRTSTISSSDGVAAPIPPNNSGKLGIPPSINTGTNVTRSPSSTSKLSEGAISPISEKDPISPVYPHPPQPSVDSPGNGSTPKRPQNLNFSATTLPTISASVPTTPVNSSIPTAPALASSSTAPLPSTPQSAEPFRAGNSMVKDFSNAQTGKVYPIQMINLERDDKSFIAFDRLQDRQNFLDILQTTRRKYFENKDKRHKTPIGLKVLDLGTFRSSEHHSSNYPDMGFGDVVDKAISSYNAPGSWPPKRKLGWTGDISCALDIMYEGRHFTFVGTANGVYGSIHPTAPDGTPLQTSYKLHWKLVASLSRVTHMEANTDNKVLLILAGTELKFSQLSEIQSLLLATSTTTVTPPQDIDTNVRSFRTGVLEDHSYLFFSKLSKARETTVIVYEVAPRLNKEKRSKGIGRLLKSGSSKPYSSFLQPPNLIPAELFSPSKVTDFSFFDKFFFFHTANEFSYMSSLLQNPQGLPKASSLQEILQKNRFPSNELPYLKEDLEKARPIAVARLSHIAHSGSRKHNPKEEPNLIHCFHKFAIMSIRNGDLYIPFPQTVNGQLCRMPYRIPYLHKIQSAYLLWPYLLLFSSNTIEIRLVTAHNFNQSLVQVITGRNIRLLTGSSAHPTNNSSTPQSSAGSSSRSSSGHELTAVNSLSSATTVVADVHNGETDKIIVSMEHPDPSIPTSVIFEIVKNSGVNPTDSALKSSLYDLDSKKSKGSHPT